MTQESVNFCRSFAIFILASLLIGCTSLELEDGDWADGEDSESQPSDSTSPIEDETGQIELLDTGTFSGEEFEISAANKDSPEKEELQLYAVSAYLDEFNLTRASELLEQLNQNQLPETLYLRQQVLFAALYIKQNDRQQAELLIENLLENDSEDEVFNDWLRLAQAQLNLDSSDFLASLELLSQDINNENTATQGNQNQAVWLFVRSQTLESLESARIQTSDNKLLGWIELGIIDKKRGQIADQLWQQSVNLWAGTYPGHEAYPVYQQLASESLVSLDNSAVRSAGRIALLLPLSSPYAEIAEIIRDGFVAASIAQGHTVSIFDTGAGTDNVVNAYRQAVFQGAQIVVGPLGKLASTHLAQTDELVKPTILLGTVALEDEEFELSPQAFMYSLDPEHEAQSLARQAYNRGFNRAAILYPDSTRGKRLNTAFVQTWAQMGGTVATSIVYPRDLYEAQETVDRLLSSATYPDVIFLASNSQQGRLLSQSIHKNLENTAIFATSSIYSGQAEPTRDFVLNDVIFSDMPWMIEGFSQAQFKKQQLNMSEELSSDSLSRFFAFGVDAYTLALRLPQFMDQPGSSISGVTGMLTLDDDRFVLNRPLVQFVDGIPQPVN